MNGTQTGTCPASAERVGTWGRVEGIRPRLLRSVALGACLLVAGFPTTGWAQGTTPSNQSQEPLKKLSIEDLAKVEVVYGASKHEQRLAEAPSSVTIVTREDIKQYGYRTLVDLLKGVRGFYVASDGAYPFAGLRGINRPGDFGGRVLVTVDGHRLNDPLYDSTFLGTEFALDVELIERVEVIRGPGSSLFGNNAFFAVINVVTRRATDVAGGEVSGATASYNAYSGRFTYGQRLANGVGVVFSGSAMAGEGRTRVQYPEFSAINNGVAENLEGLNNETIFSSVTRGGIAIQGALVNRHTGVSSAPYRTVFNDPRFKYVDERGYLTFDFTRELNADMSWRVGLSYDHYRFEGSYPYNYSAPEPGTVTINRDRARSESVGGEFQFNQMLRKRHRLTIGSELRTDLRLDFSNADDNPAFTYLNADRSATMVAAFAQDEYAVRPNLLVNAGVRYDHFDTFGGTTNPRAGVIYTPAPGTTAKLLYGQAFRAPNAYESRYQGDTVAGYKTNPDLRPEHVYSTELVYEQELSRDLRLASSFFFSDIRGLIGIRMDQADGSINFDNLTRAESRGFETELQAQWANGYRGRLGYTNARTVDEGTGLVLSNSPRHMVKGDLAVPFWQERLVAGLEVQGMSSRKTVEENGIGGFWLANLTIVARNIGRHLDVSASVYNLFDRKYGDPLSSDYRQEVLPQPGRTFRVKVTHTF